MEFTIRQLRLSLFYLFIFLLPWQTRWIIRNPAWGGDVWEYSRISLYSWDILLGVLVLVSLPLIWREIKNFYPTGGHQQSERFKIFSDPFFIYLLLLLYTLTSISWSPDKTLALVWSLRLLAGGTLWLLVRALKPKLSVIGWMLAVAGTLQAGWGIGQFVTQSTWANKWLGVAIHSVGQPGSSVALTQAGIWLRAYAGQVHPNVLGGLLVITSLATVWLYLTNKSQIRKSINSYPLLLLYIVQLIGLFFSFSRGAWLALAVSLAIWWWREYGSRRVLRPIFGLAVVVFVVLGVMLWQPTAGRLFGGTRLEQQSIEERVGSVGESQGLLTSAWWRGVGLGNYTVALQQTVPGLRSWSYQPVHNIFLLILTELGIIGLGLFLWLLWFRLRPMANRNSLLLVPILITGLFDHYWWTIPSMFMLFWLLLVIAELGAREPQAGA